MPLTIAGQVGPQALAARDGAPLAARQGSTGEIVVSELNGRYYEQTARGNVFTAANQAAATSGAGLSTAIVTLALSNDPGSGKNLVLLLVTWAYSVAPVAPTVPWLVGLFSATPVVHTTPVVARNVLVGGAAGVGKVDSVATLPLAPVVLMPIGTGAAAGAFPPATFLDLGGLLVIPPGGYVAIQALTAAIGFGSFTWAEVPI